MTVIDTPGLGSANEDISASTEELLSLQRSSLAAAEAADAVAFVLNQTVRQDDLKILGDWANAGDGEGEAEHHGLTSSAVNAIGVLTKADKLGDGRDPWPVALELASKNAERISEQVATVLPVIGLLAETANTARLTEPDVGHLATLAALDDSARESLLWSPQRFLSADCGVAPAARRHLLDCLDLFGLRFAIKRVAQGVSGAAALTAELAQTSGIEQLQKALAENFLDRRSDVLLTRSTLDALHALSYKDGNQSALRDLRRRVEALRLEPAMHELAELDALHSALTRAVDLPRGLSEDLVRLTSARTLAQRLGATDSDPKILRAAAQEGLRRWRVFATTEADPQQASIARVVIRSYTLALRTAQPQ
jgi:hypothetical protein